jgi:hypothetical protein
MNQKNSGHYFCDKCDDLAFGRVCRMCRQPARWVPSRGSAPHTVADRKVSAETAADYFRRMREAITN